MFRSRSVLVMLLLGIACPARAQEPLARIKSADFPSVSCRAVFFEQRINAADAAIRKPVLTEVSYFFDIPDPEYVAFLRRMMRDPDPVIRGRAIRRLHDLWVPLAVKDLPRTFTGYHDEQMISLGDEGTIPALLAACQGRSANPGYAAYVLGLLQHKAAVPELKKLAADQANIFVRCAAARALIDCGDKDGARPVLEEISRSQLGLYAAAPGQALGPGVRTPYYAAVSCRALMELGPADRKVGLERLITLVGHLERSADINDQNLVPTVRQMLAAVSGSYFLSEAEARKWYGDKHGK